MSQTASSINYRLGSLYSVITAFLYATQEAQMRTSSSQSSATRLTAERFIISQ
jgi:hypothetical protein